MTYRIGIFGSAFDPPTLGHKDVIEQAASICDEIILVPCIRHAFLKQPISFDERLLLLNAFLTDLDRTLCNISISMIEKELLDSAPNQPVYTYDLMNALEVSLAVRESEKQLVFIRGPDNAEPSIWSKFYRYRDIESRWELFTAKSRLSVRSSIVRALLKEEQESEQGASAITDLLSPHVAACILKYDFYRGSE